MAEKRDALVTGWSRTENKYPLKAGENLKRGRLLKLDGGKLVGANTGDEPHSILANDVDATAGDTACIYYVAGTFNANQVDFGTGTEAEFREAARLKGIFFDLPNS